jgi:hypothetical protein
MPVGEEALMDHLNLFYREEKKAKGDVWCRNYKSIFTRNKPIFFDYYAKNSLVLLGWEHFYAKNGINPKNSVGLKMLWNLH